MTSVAKVLLIGDPRLRERSTEIVSFDDRQFREECATLIATLEQFRSEHGFGRAIAAPQIGINRRIVALNLGEGPFVICNPLIVERSEETFTMWDDCMSFPWLLVRLRRDAAIGIDYFDVDGNRREWRELDRSIAELLQHEIDHLDGILAVDRALDSQSIVAREVYESDRARFDAQVDYTIEPTIRR